MGVKGKAELSDKWNVLETKKNNLAATLQVVISVLTFHAFFF